MKGEEIYSISLEKLEKKIDNHFEQIKDLQKAILVNSLYDEINQKNWKAKLDSNLQVIVQYQYKDYSMDNILEAVMRRQKDIRPCEEIISLEVYIKPEEEMVYYVVNGIESKDYQIALTEIY